MPAVRPSPTSARLAHKIPRMVSVPQAVNQTVLRLASRTIRSEADIQTDVSLLLTLADLGLDEDDVVKREVPTADGTRRRIDVEVGHCVIELKKDLRTGNVLGDAETQLAGYVESQQNRLGSRYVGILTDGTTWRLYRLNDENALQLVDELVLDERAPDTDKLLVWLESVLATREAIAPVPVEIEQRLGAGTPSYRLDHATLAALYDVHRADPEVGVKRELWAKLLRTAFGQDFVDNDSLFIDHTLIVIIAEIVAHAAVGFDITLHGGLTARALTCGSEFANAQIYGVVEEDFFDWVVEIPGGEEFVSDLTRRIARFDWSNVEHDILKVLYESIIRPDDRRQLGEYYTPDWLANRIVAEAVTDPLNQSVLDPAAGSGTFVFHAVRGYLDAADAKGTANAEAILEVTRRVFGMDVHPVAVILCRVTYLLAIGGERIRDTNRPALTIPVYLGDSVQWEQRLDLYGGVDEIRVSTAGTDLVDEGGGTLMSDDLVFPRSILADARRFDMLVNEMAELARTTSTIDSLLKRFAITGDDAATLRETFATMRALHETNRNHIWGYYVRNLIRPIWLAEAAHKVDVCLGNPPWLRYNRMRPAMQERFRSLAADRGLLTGGLGASARELSTLFVVRCAELYSRLGGRFAFVMPHGVLTRRPHTGFRSGNWTGPDGTLTVSFEVPWDLSEINTGFPNVSCVVFGISTNGSPGRMATDVLKWIGQLPREDMSWVDVEPHVRIESSTVEVLASDVRRPESVYRRRFRQGAILVPRMLLFVEELGGGPLGAGAGRVRVTSRRAAQEKDPWKEQPSLSGTVERPFIRDVLLGESVTPYRQLPPRSAVLPLGETAILTQEQVALRPGLSNWWEQVEERWEAGRSTSETLPLLERFDFHGQLSSQLPAAPHRVVYSASGVNLIAARVVDTEAIVEHKLYWAAAQSVSEARYLTAILNSSIIRDRARPLQGLGLYGPRDFDTMVFFLPIPEFDSHDAAHMALADLAAHAEDVAADVELNDRWGFRRKRTAILRALDNDGVAQQIEDGVAALVPVAAVEAQAAQLADADGSAQ
jgi:hypothetical protein